MYISNVSASNLKGRSFAHALTPATLVVGPNFSGKTSIVEAIRLALIGYIPEIGKQNNASFELSSGREMSVGATIEEGATAPHTIERRYWMERGSVKSEGSESGYATPLLDYATYFELTESKRIDYVFQRVIMPPAYTLDGIIAKLQQITFGKDHSEHMEAAKAETIKEVQAQFAAKPDLREAISFLADEFLKTAATVHKGKAKDSQGAVRILTELKNREGECSAETLTDLRNEGSRLAGLIAECNKEFGSLTAQRAESERIHKRRLVLLATVAEQEPAWTPPTKRQVPVPAAQGWVELEQQLEDAEAELAKVPNPDPQLEVAVARATAAWRARHEISTAARIALVAKQQQIRSLTTEACCPFCKSDAEGWQARVLQGLTFELEPLVTALHDSTEAETDLAQTTAAAEKALETAQETDAMHADLSALCARLRLEIANRKLIADKAAAKHQGDLQRAESDYRSSLVLFESQKQKWQDQRQRDTEELTRLEEVPAPTAVDMETVQRKATELQQQATEANTKIKTGEQLAQDLRRAAQAAAQHELSKARADVLTRVRGTLQEIKGEMVAAAFESLLGTANAIVGDLLASPLAYDAENNELGRMGESGFIAHRAFSGSEKALAYVAIAAALSAKAPFKLLILDELGRLQPSLQDRTLDRLYECIDSGILDQVIGVLPMDQGDLAPQPMGYSVIKLEGK